MSEPCARCHSPLEEGDLRCAICALPAVDHRLRPTPLTARATILRCRECHAAVTFAPDAGAPRCGFCDATMTVEHPIDPIEIADRLVPFTVDREMARGSLRRWLGARGWFAPRTLGDEAVLESLTPLSWAAWIVDARADVAWAADSDHGAERARWAPHAGVTALSFDQLCVPASRGLTIGECVRLAPYYNLESAVPVGDSTAVEAGTWIEAYDAQRSAARGLIQRTIEDVARARVQREIPGRRFRNVAVSCLLAGLTTARVALPAWIMAYRFRGNPYRAIVHGQRAELVIGRAPIDWRRVVGAVVSGIVIVAAAIAIAGWLAGCHREPPPPDAGDFFDRCDASGTFAPVSGRMAVSATLNVHVDSGGLLELDTSSKMLLVVDLEQQGTQLTVSSTLCRVRIPDIPLAGQEMPITFDVPDATVASVPTASGSGELSVADQLCTPIRTAPTTIIVGAKLSVPDGPLPAADDNGAFRACAPTNCAATGDRDCACDQEDDGAPGATLIAHNVPAIELDQVYVALRTTFFLDGRVHASDLLKGRIDASLETAVLGCRLVSGTPCTTMNVNLVKTLNPIVTPLADNPSTFRAVRIAPAMTCGDVIANEGVLFPR